MFQADDFVVDGGGLALQLALPAVGVGDRAVERGLLLGQARAFRADPRGQCREGGAVTDRVQPGVGDGGVEPSPGISAGLGLGPGLAGESLQLADTVPAGFGALLDEGVVFGFEFALPGLGSVLFPPQPGALGLQRGDLLGE